jgi:S-DNA-T family DNA segregation ATPase FtsK/SpoIIIE
MSKKRNVTRTVLRPARKGYSGGLKATGLKPRLRQMTLKRKVPANTDSQAVATLLWQRLQEGGFILFMTLSIFLLVALVSYNAADPGWSQTAASKSIQNAAGQVGAWFADLCFYFFGYIAYLIPTLIAYGSFRLLQQQQKIGVFHRILWTLRMVGFVSAMGAGCGLASLHFGGWNVAMPVGVGGICGQLLSAALGIRLGTLGSTLSLTAVFLAGITLATGLSWFGLVDRFSVKTCLEQWSCFKGQVKLLWESIKQKLTFKKLKSSPERIAMAKTTPTLFKNVKKEPVLLEIERIERVERSIKTTIKPRPTIQKPAALALIPTSLPAFDLLEASSEHDVGEKLSTQSLEALSLDVERKLAEFGVEVKVVAVYPGPVITRFELELAAGLKVSKISGLAKDLARALSVTRVRVVEVIPGKPVVGLEIPNSDRELVRLREILESAEYQESLSPLSLALGKDIQGHPTVVNLAKMPHLLVAGTTGSGKSVGINVMLLSLLYKAPASEVKLILIDPKMLELSVYDGIPHLLTPVVTDMKDAANALRWCVAEMERRYQLMAALGVRNLLGFNRKIQEAFDRKEPLIDPLWNPDMGTEPVTLSRLPYIVVIIDEFADMMMVVGKKVEELIARIAQKARAAGIHLILATQRPSVDVITGLIKANVPTRIAFQVSSRIDSRTILDQQGAEQLLGHGDMLYLAPGSGVPVRIHGAFVSDDEVHAVVKALKQMGEPDFTIDVLKSQSNRFFEEDAEGEGDDLYDTAVQIVMESRRASISHLQRRLKIGYNRAARLIESMETAGLVSVMQQNGNREVLANDHLME